jgi:3-oxoacyl-[acyl-carrier protein] reductase
MAIFSGIAANVPVHLKFQSGMPSHMADRYQQFTGSPPGRFMARRLGLPQPAELRRGPALLDGPALLGGKGRLGDLLARMGLQVREGAERYAAVIFDASHITRTGDLREVYEFFHDSIGDLAPSGRLVVIGSGEGVAQRALEGFVRSAAKEVRHGATAQLVYAAADAELESTLRFLLSGRSAYVSGQVIRVAAAVPDPPDDWERPLAGKVAVVTGASRGIGAAIAEVLARDGAHVVCADVPAQGEDLAAVANRVGGSALALDVTADRAPGTLADHLSERHGGVDVVVHNAGITRDRTLARMSEDQWDSVMAVNLEAIERLNVALGEELRRGGRIVCVSSMSGIAGNRGQANYATSKAGVIGVVEELAPVLAKRQCTINAVAPGFIETRMTASMPLATREAGRRMNSLAQGGLPVDVAETIAWLASPGSAGVNGNVVRVCGQSLIGA